MGKARRNKNRVLSLLATLMLVMTLFVPIIPVSAAGVADAFDIGEPAFDAGTGILQYSSAMGYGTGLYTSIVISFTSVRQNNEQMVLPSMSGFEYNAGISNDATKTINMPEGKT